jgi:putative acetyltransferase
VGARLLAAGLDWARATGVVTRLELAVYAENARAIHLYEKFGFTVEGRRRRAVRHRARWVDDVLMARLL